MPTGALRASLLMHTLVFSLANAVIKAAGK